jgi:hypothetical protein
MFQLNHWFIHIIILHYAKIRLQNSWNWFFALLSLFRRILAYQSSVKFNYVENIHCAIKTARVCRSKWREWSNFADCRYHQNMKKCEQLKISAIDWKRFINKNLSSIIECFHVYHRCAACVYKRKQQWKIHVALKSEHLAIFFSFWCSQCEILVKCETEAEVEDSSECCWWKIAAGGFMVEICV